MSTVAELFIKRERDYLSPFAFLTENTEGRLFPCPPSECRTEFQRDRDRILHSKSFRRLMHKTQVFFSPEEEHYRTRMTHTL
ncbi:MAG: deoxyguanosinetriphosphate triphosphohydrolase, partial [Clostridia bacterium]|nr:deoxyguanosinetriphosphate triphosphohydrolase [Clostridia bacterium]